MSDYNMVFLPVLNAALRQVKGDSGMFVILVKQTSRETGTQSYCV